MTKVRQKWFLCALGGFIALLVVLIALFMWIITKYHPHSQQESRIYTGTTMEGHGMATSAPSFNQNKEETPSYLEDLASDVEYVKPIKISTMLMLSPEKNFNFSEYKNKEFPPYLRHHTGHFRRRYESDDWDYRPRYEIEAFGKRIELDLQRNDSFLAPNLSISRMDHTERITNESGASNLRRCYYSGKVKGDVDSYATVSLCDGMTGVISTSDGFYFIEPAIKVSNVSTIPESGSFIHRIKRLKHTIHHNAENEIDASFANGAHHCDLNDHDEVVDDDGEDNNGDMRNVIRNRRHLLTYDEEEEDGRFPKQRTYNNEYFIKAFVVVDKSMVDYHRSTEILQHYILVLMSHAALLYKDPSIGNPVSLTVVNILMVDFGFTSNNSQEMLGKFCAWQTHRNETYDMALLLTRDPICRKNSTNYCDTLGLAEVGSMCGASNCAIVRENGLSTSYTIAHEIGHMLSMPHDSTASCKKFNSNGAKYNYIMTNVMNNGTKPRSWSECSKHYVTDFLPSHRGQCLLVAPLYNYITSNFTHNLPGEKFTTDKQCELEFGTAFSDCPYTEDQPPCRMLWCTANAKTGCKSNQLAWADGTVCGVDRWCYQGECVRRHALTPIDGGWGVWGAWSGCSRTCGGGVKFRRRECDSPTPQNGGQYCAGYGIEYRWCNSDACAPFDADFRAVQCAQFNGVRRSHDDARCASKTCEDDEWTPDHNVAVYDRCKLYCRTKNSNLSFLLKEKVVDGTRCDLNSFDVCVDGYCRKGGCDNRLGSDVSLDECGVCGGDNSTCRLMFGSYNTIAAGYREILHIPSGSFNLAIWQNATQHDDSNYLVLVDGDNGDFILNSKTMISPQEKDFMFGDVNISYSGSSAIRERIYATNKHKLTKKLILGVLSVGEPLSPNINYQYMIDENSAPRYGWNLYPNPWPQCSSLCNGTKNVYYPACINLANGQKVIEAYCNPAAKDNYVQGQACNTHCQLMWNEVKRDPCSVHCGNGNRTIHYNCIKISLNSAESSNEIVDPKHCRPLNPRPPLTEPCFGTLCHSNRWHYAPWSPCTAACGTGTQNRTAICVNSYGHPTPPHHCLAIPKTSQQQCNTQKCPVWRPKEYGACTGPCGHSIQHMHYYCHLDGQILAENACNPSLRPNQTRTCQTPDCHHYYYQWRTGGWSECSASCGEGMQTRSVACYEQSSKIDDDQCGTMLKPNATKLCKIKCHDDDDNNNNNNSAMRHESRYEWSVAHQWSECSKQCNGGVQSRRVVCLDRYGEVSADYCRTEARPLATQECNAHACSAWSVGEWSACQTPKCEKRRTVSCRNRCDMDDKPAESAKCRASECYRWMASPWKQCDKSCGSGQRRRSIQCIDFRQNFTLVDNYCADVVVPKPKAVKKCTRYNCRFVWVEGPWTECSANCNGGRQTRNVTCHAVQQRGYVDPNALIKYKYDEYCEEFMKPMTQRNCNVRVCRNDDDDKNLFVWRTNGWSECSHSCGKRGRQTRDVFCVDNRTQRSVAKHHCPVEGKPRRKYKCNQWRCLFKNCKDVQRNTGNRANREYTLSVRNRAARIYCYKMDTNEPEEYISLQGDTINTAENYDKRLKQPNRCPYDGQRHENCDCLSIEAGGWSGLTSFWKVRLNVTSLQIDGRDFTFSVQKKGAKVAYGTAGDCYSEVEGCSQARFSIDLSGTSFKLSENVTWRKSGNNATLHIQFYNGRRKVEARCGGYCGQCEPSMPTGLQVELA